MVEDDEKGKGGKRPTGTRRLKRTRTHFDRQESATRHQIIREHADELGWFTIPDLAKDLISQGLYTEAELEEGKVRWVARDIKEALRHQDESGLPFAGATADGLHKVRHLWSARDYDFNLKKRNRNLVDDYEMAMRFRDEYKERYGVSFPLHKLVIHK